MMSKCLKHLGNVKGTSKTREKVHFVEKIACPNLAEKSAGKVPVAYVAGTSVHMDQHISRGSGPAAVVQKPRFRRRAAAAPSALPSIPAIATPAQPAEPSRAGPGPLWCFSIADAAMLIATTTKNKNFHDNMSEGRYSSEIHGSKQKRNKTEDWFLNTHWFLNKSDHRYPLAFLVDLGEVIDYTHQSTR
jgi:hypothetical protein